MNCVSVLIACLLSSSALASHRSSTTRRYKPIIQVTEEIDINDITFTTSAPDAAYYKGHPRLTDAPSSGVFTPHGPKNSYAVPIEKTFAGGHALKYKPYKVVKVQEGLRPLVPYKPRQHDAPKFEPPTTYTSPERFTSKVVPFSSQLPVKAPVRTSSFPSQDTKSFVPSPTFSPALLARLNSETAQKFPEPTPHPHNTQNWPKPTKKPYHIKKPNNHPPATLPDDFPTPSPPPPALKDSPQQSESLLSEVSTLHKGGSGLNDLEEVADSLDLKTGERVEFQMYGMDGPKSYKFGFDTGKGENRHFRFEERDNTGKVKGHYGYVDEDGKMRIMKYEADPVTGFHAGPVEVSPDDN